MPSILQDFEYDIFISYRQKDNKVDGWVTGFITALKAELDATLKNPVSIYFDENPDDGLLETHQVNASLDKKLKCIVFMPIVSQTYCDPGSYAWQHEFQAFIQRASTDSLGLNVQLGNGNVASRVLPIQIHELDAVDRRTIEAALGGPMRAVPFIYSAPGVNRPLLPHEEHPENNKNHTSYRDQINKVANALKEIGSAVTRESRKQEPAEPNAPPKKPDSKLGRVWRIASTLLIAASIVALAIWHNYRTDDDDLTAAKASIAVIPFRNNTGDTNMSHYGVGIASEVSTKLGLTKKFDFISSLQATIQYQQSDKSPADIGKELGVTHILTGMYQTAGDNIQVLVELMDAGGKVIWSIPYKTRYNDIFEVQANIAQRVMDKFAVQQTREGVSYTPNMQAYTHTIKALEIVLKSNRPEDRMKAVSEYQAAIALDSGFIEPWWGIIEEYCYYYWNRGPKGELTLEMIQPYLDYVQANFPDNWKKKTVLGTYEYWALAHYQKGLDLFLQALDEAPQDAGVHSMVAAIYRRQLKLNDSFRHISVSIKQAPGAVIFWIELLALAEMNGDYDNAIKAAETVYQLNPELTGNLYRFRIWTGTLDQLPAEVKDRRKLIYRADKLLEDRKLKELLAFVEATADSAMNSAIRSYYQVVGHYLLRQDGHAKKLAEKYLRLEDGNLERRANVLAILKNGSEFEKLQQFPGHSPDEDLSEHWMKDTDQFSYLALSGNYEDADEFLKYINKTYPQVGAYAWLNQPIYDRAKEDFPALKTTISQLKMPPRVVDTQLIKM